MSGTSIGNNAVWRFLGSVRLAIVLLVLIIIVSFVGAVLPEEKAPLVYYSWWFIALLAVFAVNILACSASRLSLRRNRLGSTLTHLAVLVILAGSLISFMFCQRGSLELEEGQVADSFVAQDRTVRLPFQVRLEDFTLTWYQNEPEKFVMAFYVVDKDYKQRFSMERLKRQELGASGYSAEIIDYLPDFALDENHKPVSRSADAHNPAALVRLRDPAGSTEDRWVFAKHPDFSRMRDANIKAKFLWQPMVKEFRSTVAIIDGKAARPRAAVIKVNAPFQYKGYTFYQAGYDDNNLRWTSLEAVRDPGTGIVFAGFLLLNAGIILCFLTKRKIYG